MKKGKRILSAVLMFFLLTGCGKTTVEMSNIAIQKNGSIEHTLIEDFSDSSIDALQKTILEKAAAYNNANQSEDGIKVNSIEESDGKVKVVMEYPSAAAFDGFMNMDVVAVDPALRAPFFYGTVEEAFEQGFDLEVTLQSAENNDEVLQGKSDFLEMGKNRLIIYDNEMNLGAPIQIDLPKKPLYISDNVTVAGKKRVEISETEELAYIVIGK